MSISFGSDFRRFFSRGLAVILPTVLTIALIGWLLQAIDKYIGKYITYGTQWLISHIWEIPAGDVQATWDRYYLDFAGFLIAIVLVYFVGRFVASFLGRAAWRAVEQLLIRLPLIKQIYPSIKQVTDFIILSDAKVKFSRVVAVEYPRKGIWSLGLVTSPGMRTLHEVGNSDLLTLFIPSSPMPVTGYTIIVRRDEVIDLPFDIDEALRFTVSGGVIVPPAEAMDRNSSDELPEGKKR